MWRSKTLDLLYRIVVLCGFIELFFRIFVESNKNKTLPTVWIYGSIFISLILLTIFRGIPYRFRAIGLAIIILLAGVVEFFTTGISGDGRMLLIAAPLIALLLSGTRTSCIISALSLTAFVITGLSVNIQDFPINIIPVETSINPITWVSSGFLFAAVLVALVTLVWQFTKLNRQTFKHNDRLASEGKSLRELTRNIQARDAELQALVNAIDDQVLVIDNEGRIIKNAEVSFRNSASENSSRYKNVLRILPQPQSSELITEIQNSLSTWQTRVFDYYLVHDGVEHWYSATISPFEVDKVVMISRDITESINTNSREREHKVLSEALKSTAAMLNSTLELQEVLTNMLAAVCDVISTDLANIMLLGDRGRLDSMGRTNLKDGHLYTERLNKMSINDLQVLRTMKRSASPLLISDVSEYPAWCDILGENQIRSFLGTPIIVKGKVVGFLTLQSIQPDFYTQQHVDRLQSFIDLAGIAIENANLYRETQKLAISDELTGLFNRRGLMDIGQREIDRAKRFHHPLAVAIIDIDDFKMINDTYGHIVGDKILNQIADYCRANFREIDIIARYGGDEFVILMIENEVDRAFNIADRLREIISKNVFKTDVGNLTTTISIGVAAIDDRTENLGQIIEKADRGLYLAKEAGRNRTIAV